MDFEVITVQNKNPRAVALKVLIEITQQHVHSNKAIQKVLIGEPMTDVDRRLMVRLVYGVLEHRLQLEAVVRTYSDVRFGKINKRILMILLMAFYQIRHLDRIPDSAVVNEAVKLAKKENYRYKNFVNAVLRAYLREPEKFQIPPMEQEPILHLSLTYSHPEWLVARWIERYGETFTRELLAANNRIPPVTLRPNPLKIGREALITHLEEEGVITRPGSLYPEMLVIERMPVDKRIDELDSYRKGYFQIQGEASALTGLILSPEPGERVLDACAAPGGKATHLATLMDNRGLVVARDVSEGKLHLIREAAERLGLQNMRIEQRDAAKHVSEDDASFDRILVDAPCTGLGIIAKKPEIRYERTPGDIDEMSSLQKRILATSAAYLKPGGVLVYSTCTIEPEENRAIVEDFLAHHENFERVDFSGELPVAIEGAGSDLQLYPHRHRSDGFYMAKLRKKEAKG